MTRIALIVQADEPAIFYASTEAAARDLEAIDVRNGVYPAAYGPNGELFRISACGERVLIDPIDAPPDGQALQTLLRRFLAAIGIFPGDSESVADLLARCERYIER